jgi:hypothetical protein
MSDHHQHGALLARPPKRDPSSRRAAAPAKPEAAPAQVPKKPASALDRFIDRFFRLH